MAQGKDSFRYESLQDVRFIHGVFKSITKGLASGSLSFSDEDGEIIMEPKGLLNLKLTATKEDDQRRITVRVTWQDEQKNIKKRKMLSVNAATKKK